METKRCLDCKGSCWANDLNGNCGGDCTNCEYYKDCEAEYDDYHNSF